jgi:hypothetical protein
MPCSISLARVGSIVARFSTLRRSCSLASYSGVGFHRHPRTRLEGLPWIRRRVHNIPPNSSFGQHCIPQPPSLPSPSSCFSCSRAHTWSSPTLITGRWSSPTATHCFPSSSIPPSPRWDALRVPRRPPDALSRQSRYARSTHT